MGTDRTGKLENMIGPRVFYCQFIIEVKPTIKSIGETMRQLKVYKAFLQDNCKIILVTQSTNVEIFREQGIRVFVVTDEMLNNGRKFSEKISEQQEV